jgi:hypothetical protein
MSTKRITPEIRMMALDAIRSGLSIRDAAALSGVSVGSATRWAKAAGVRGRPAPIRYGEQTRDAALRAVADGLTPHEAAAKFAAPVARVRFWLKQANVA